MWRTDVENAPQDGSDVLIFAYGFVGVAWRFEKYGGKWTSHDDNLNASSPTHWMPLPDLPSTPT